MPPTCSSWDFYGATLASGLLSYEEFEAAIEDMPLERALALDAEYPKP